MAPPFMYIVPFLLAPLLALSQPSGSGQVSGTLIIGERPVGFNSIVLPDGTRKVPYFNYIPGSKQYAAGKGRHTIPLHTIKRLTLLRMTEEERHFIADSCPGCSLWKAVMQSCHAGLLKEQTIYLCIDYIMWKDTRTVDFSKARKTEIRYLDALITNEECK